MNLIKHNFGSYRGYLTHLQACVAASLGAYASARNLDLRRVSRLVFVCKGNVCRSPYAEAKAIALGFPAISFGLDTTGGVSANPDAYRAAKTRDVELSAHRSMLFAADALSESDLVLAFQPDHHVLLKQLARSSNAQFSLLGLWAEEGARAYVADPYGKSDKYFDKCFQIIDASVVALVNALHKAHALRD